MFRYALLSTLIVLGLNVSADSGPIDSGPLKVGELAPCVDLKHLSYTGAETVRSTCQAPEKPGQNRVLSFFGTWCKYCIKDLPVFESLAQKFKGQAVFRLVGVDKELDMRNYFKNKDFSNYELAFDPQSAAYDAFGLEGVPTLIVIGPDQRVKYIFVGVIEPENLAEVEKAIAN
jgi:thiol-disulfide isomerase/thioredoxin